MKNWLLIGGGILITLVGLVWMFQGLNVFPGSGMSGSLFWALVGPVVAGVGLGLAIFGFRRLRRAS